MTIQITYYFYIFLITIKLDQAYQNIKQLYEQLVEKNKSINSETCQTSLEVCIQLNIFSKDSFLYFIFCFELSKQLNLANQNINQLEQKLNQMTHKDSLACSGVLI